MNGQQRHYLGIDLGTTNSVLAEYDSIKNKAQVRCSLIPSVVNLLSGEAGQEQKKLLLSEEDNSDIIGSFKVDMQMSELGEIPIYASSCVLTKVKEYMREDTEAVITVPAYFNDNQRRATKKAATIAGINVLALVNEPTAAAIYYNSISDLKGKTIAVYDLGGGTFDVSIVNSDYGIFDVLATEGLKLGGDNLNRAIYNDILTRCDVTQHRLTESISKTLIELSEVAKLNVQHSGDTKISFPEFSKVFGTTEYILTSKRYEELVNSVFGVTIQKLKRTIATADIDLDDLEIMLVGGSTRDPYVIQMVSKIKKPLPVTYNPDQVVALGASVYAELAANNKITSRVSDVTKGVGIVLFDGTVKYMIPPNSKVPIAESSIYFNVEESDGVVIEFSQGSSGLHAGNSSIGKMLYKFNQRESAYEGRIALEMQVTVDGLFKVFVKEPLGRLEHVELKV